MVCPKCQLSYCVPYAPASLAASDIASHRLPIDHNCAPIDAKPAAKPHRALSWMNFVNSERLSAPRAARPQFIQQKMTDFKSARTQKAAAQVRSSRFLGIDFACLFLFAARVDENEATCKGSSCFFMPHFNLHCRATRRLHQSSDFISKWYFPWRVKWQPR
jgi:hypothetical protein